MAREAGESMQPRRMLGHIDKALEAEETEMSWHDIVVVPQSGRVFDNNQTDVRSAAVSARVVPPLALEIGHRFQVADPGSTTFSMPTLVRFGLPARLELRLATNFIAVDSGGTRPPDLTFGAKGQLVDARRAALGLLAEARLDFDKQTDAVGDLRLGLLGDLTFLPRLTLRSNATLLYLSGLTRSRSAFGYAGELSALLTRQWLLFAGSSGLVADQTAVASRPVPPCP